MHVPTVTDEMLEKVLQAAASPVVVEITSCSRECSRSRRWMEDIAEDFDDRFIFLRVFEEENPTVVKQYGVTVFPSMIIFKRGAHNRPQIEFSRHEGDLDAQTIRGALEAAKNGRSNADDYEVA